MPPPAGRVCADADAAQGRVCADADAAQGRVCAHLSRLHPRERAHAFLTGARVPHGRTFPAAGRDSSRSGVLRPLRRALSAGTGTIAGRRHCADTDGR
jgi:hypothetical protein